MSARDVIARHRAKIVPSVALVIAAIAVATFWGPLYAWFSGDERERTEPRARGSHADHPTEPPARRGPDVPALSARELPPEVLAHVQSAFAAYEQIRDLLARDATDGLARHAEAMATSLGLAAEPADGTLEAVLRGAAHASSQLASAREIADARLRFGDVSKYLVAIAGADPRAAEGLHVFKCPMADGFQKWFQRSPELANPYMGTSMLECGVRTDWTIEEPAPQASSGGGGGGEIAYYTCGMHPSVRRDEPGTCPICGMDLTPVTEEEVRTGVIFVDEAKRRRIGVKLAPVERRALSSAIRAVGEVVYDETKLHDVNLRMSGWIERLVADETGQRVRRGQTLFTLYSPELYAAQLEYLNASRSRASTSAAGGTLAATTAGLAQTARQRLLLLGMEPGQITQLERRGEPWQNVPILAPATGYVIEKNIVAGAQVEAGMRVYRIADLDEVWVDAQIYESDLPNVRQGQRVEITVPYLPGRTFEGSVDYVYPALDRATRTGRVRVRLANRGLELRPDMYANVVLHADLGERVVVPDAAVIYTGPRRVVFVDLGEGRLRPQEIEVGARVEGFYEVVRGVEVGDVVVTSGNFLIASESRLKSAAGLWGEGEGGDEQPGTGAGAGTGTGHAGH